MKTKEELDSLEVTLKAQYGTIYTVGVPVEDSDEERTIFLKKIDRNTLAAAQKIMSSSSDTFKVVEMIIKNTYVGGDELAEILSNFDMIRSLESVIVEMMTVKKATLKKN